jgi:hypothetical protein
MKMEGKALTDDIENNPSNVKRPKITQMRLKWENIY